MRNISTCLRRLLRIYLIKQILTYLDKLTALVDQLQIDIQITVIKGVYLCLRCILGLTHRNHASALRLRNMKRKPHTRKCTIDIELIAIGAGKCIHDIILGYSHMTPLQIIGNDRIKGEALGIFS